MPTYRVLIDDADTGDLVTAASYADAYFDIASSLPLTYKNNVKLVKVKPGEDDLILDQSQSKNSLSAAGDSMIRGIHNHNKHKELRDRPAVTESQNVYSAIEAESIMSKR